jgi:hypothetical protein
MGGREGVGIFWNESEHARRLALVLTADESVAWTPLDGSGVYGDSSPGCPGLE